jgi:hypothetical protein
MLATITNARFSVPENPVMRAVAGFGLLQAGNGYAMGQSVDMPLQALPLQASGGGFLSAGGGSGSPRQIVGPDGVLIYTGDTDGSIYTASFCNKLIMGGAGSDADKFQCSIRGYVGNSPVASIPPALVPAAPTSVTIPRAVQIVNTPRPAPVARAQRRCDPSVSDGIDGNTAMIALGALALGFLLFGGANGRG